MTGAYLIDSRNFNKLINAVPAAINNTDQKIWTRKKESTPNAETGEQPQGMTVTDPYNTETIDSYRKKIQA
jgi:hypothetical protein